MGGNCNWPMVDCLLLNVFISELVSMCTLNQRKNDTETLNECMNELYYSTTITIDINYDYNSVMILLAVFKCKVGVTMHSG